jgi:8-amino-7-oxononanoate synthase
MTGINAERSPLVEPNGGVEQNSVVEPGGPLGWLDTRARERTAAGLRRHLRPRDPDGDGLLDLAGNDYLGLTRHPKVVAAAAAAAHRWGAGSTGSRLVTGATTLHAELEAELAAFTGAAAALVFSSGYLANLAVLTALAGRGDLIVSDAVNHASIIDGCRLSRARVAVVAHRDIAAVDSALAARTERRALVVTDAVFSVDSDLAPLRELADVVRAHHAVLVVDEAHALGVVGTGGRGAVHQAGLAGTDDVISTVTLSKSLGSQGGAVLGSAALVAHLVDAARPFIFDTGLAPANVGAALAALRLLVADPGLAERARGNARAVHRVARDLGFSSPEPAGAVTALLLGSPAAAARAAEICAKEGVRVGCFRPPSVPDGVSRLRVTARADLVAADFELLRHALDAVRSSAVS